MTILPLDLPASRTPDALRDFLRACQAAAAARRHPQLVSISLEVDALDPLAVLESIFEPGERHFYVERVASAQAVAGAEAVASWSAAGPDRFAACQRFIDETLDHCIAVGDLDRPFAGPHFFAAFPFAEDPEPGEPFAAAHVFVPRWQVAAAEGRTLAVANLIVSADAPVEPLAERVWRAHGKFAAFDYSAPEFTEPAPRTAAVREAGQAGRYAAAVRASLQDITAGQYEKIVLARAKDLEAPERLHPLRMLNGLRERFPDCYAFSVANGRGQSFIGASPERLLAVKAGRLRTEALAGSARRGVGASEDAAWAAALGRDQKELREHRLVTEAIAAQLRELGLVPHFPDKPGLRRFANVQHLHTPIEAELPPAVHLLDVAAGLHPTPAVGGAPRAQVLPRIRELEGFPRGLYAGALDWIDCRGDGELFVGLRSALIDGCRARLYAGAGIVEGSDPEKELAETELKFNVMEAALLA